MVDARRSSQIWNQRLPAGVRIAMPIRRLAHSKQWPVPREIQNERAFPVSGLPQPRQGFPVLDVLFGELSCPFDGVDKDRLVA